MGLTQSRDSDLYVCGWRLRTGLVLPESLAWPERDRRTPDVMFAEGRVAESLKNPVLDLEVLQVASRGTALVRFPGIARFLIRKRRAVAELEIDHAAPELTAVMFGNVAAAICWRRGQLALHGSAVAIHGRAVLLLGRTDTGKSLLAAALALRGHSALSDELAAVARGRCYPAGSALCLADDALRALGIARRGLPQIRHWRLAKRLWRSGPGPEPQSYPVGAVVCLKKGEPGGRNRMRRLRDDAAIDAILNQFFRRGMLEIGDSARIARREARAVARVAPVYEFTVARDLDRIGVAADAIEKLVRRAARRRVGVALS